MPTAYDIMRKGHSDPLPHTLSLSYDFHHEALSLPLPLGATISKSSRPQEEKLSEQPPTFLLQHTHPRTKTQSTQGTVPPSPSLPSSPRGCFRLKFTPATQTCVSNNSQHEKLPGREKNQEDRSDQQQAKKHSCLTSYKILSTLHVPITPAFFPFRQAKEAAVGQGQFLRLCLDTQEPRRAT